jgi:hypothetical protein
MYSEIVVTQKCFLYILMQNFMAQFVLSFYHQPWNMALDLGFSSARPFYKDGVNYNENGWHRM